MFGKSKEEKRRLKIEKLKKQYDLGDLYGVQIENFYYLYQLLSNEPDKKLAEKLKLIVMEINSNTDMANLGATIMLLDKIK
ncbi:hypothetical protein [Clostridium thermobutyricum]|uniref:hypothetical protein n=1 Tax=Clostridium thermobutyricum TaxID=29372 RepID=UPI0018AAE72A|nr:hypothetical protein [Clostridium thermobutyricum]